MCDGHHGFGIEHQRRPKNKGNGTARKFLGLWSWSFLFTKRWFNEPFVSANKEIRRNIPLPFIQPSPTYNRQLSAPWHVWCRHRFLVRQSNHVGWNPDSTRSGLQRNSSAGFVGRNSVGVADHRKNDFNHGWKTIKYNLLSIHRIGGEWFPQLPGHGWWANWCEKKRHIHWFLKEDIP